MNEKIDIDSKSLNYILVRSKPYAIPVVIILVSIILFFQFVIPQFHSLLAARKEAQDSVVKLGILKKNLAMLANIDDGNLNSQVNTVKLVLPSDKDFIGVLNSIYFASQRTGVSLGSFSITVGDISNSANSSSAPDIKLSIPVNGGITEINNFVETISKLAPLSEIYSIKTGGVSSVVNLSFYYKPLEASNYSPDILISPISQTGLDLISELNGFENISSTLQPTPQATSSAEEPSPDEGLE
jgi:hypothetical protein